MKVKEWITNNKKRILAVLVLLVVLVTAFWYGGSGSSHGWNVGGAKQTSSEETESLLESESEKESGSEHASKMESSDAESKEQSEASSNTETEQGADAAPESNAGQTGQSAGAGLAGKSETGNTQSGNSTNSTGDTSGSSAQSGQQTSNQANNAASSQTQPTSAPTTAPTAAPAPTQAAATTCTISISCSTVWSHADQLSDGLAAILPADGQILGDTVVTFTQGESVFDVLQRVCRERGIQMESSFTPAYNSAYIEGIHNLYEFDCGSLSGWMYSVNGVFPNYGCSGYAVQNGDVIRWVYTCDLGKDVGAGSAAQH